MIDSTPDTVLDNKDRGDDTFLRYRYQATYAAILSIGLIARKSECVPEFIEIFCEHHNDILLKLRSGRFLAVQVKTQQPGGNPFKPSDDAIKKSLVKFVLHEISFGDSFERYLIVTNHHFYRANKKTSLFHLVKKALEAKGADPADMDNGLSGFINSFIKSFNKELKGTGKANREHMLSVLKKLHIDDSLPKLQDIHGRLREAIREAHDDCRASTYADLESAAEKLSYMTYEKSSLPNKGVSHLYLSYVEKPSATADAAVIVSKRIISDDISELLARVIAERPLLTAADPIDPNKLPADLSVAEKKLTAGGLSATTVAAARDWQASTEYLERQWAARYGEQSAIDRYNAVATAVQTACSEAHEATRSEDAQGPKMLEELKESLKRSKENGAEFFNCQEEHLLGHAVIRTGQCKVWWSKEFNVN